MSEQTKNDIIDGMASEIADMTMNGASDEELKEAIDNSKDIIDNLKNDIIDSLKVDFRNLYFDPYTEQKIYCDEKEVKAEVSAFDVAMGNERIELDELIDRNADKIIKIMIAATNDDIEPYALEMAIKYILHDTVDMAMWNFSNTATFRAEFADNGWMDHICSNCGYTVNDDVHVQYDWNYCPNCGARFVKKPKSYISNASDIVNAITKKCF